MNQFVDSSSSEFPEELRAELNQNLPAGESIVAWFANDLNGRREFSRGWIVLTEKRILSFPYRNGRTESGEAIRPESEWEWDENWSLTASDTGGLGTLELHGPGGLVERWYYTARQATRAHLFVDRFQALRLGLPTEPEEESEAEAAEDDVPTPQAAAGSLFRLLQFARPRAGMIFLGFVLTLATTAAGLIPPYLTMPLVDNILVPYQSEVERVREHVQDPAGVDRELAIVQERGASSFRLVPLYLFGLAGAAVAAWALGWGQGAVMAWVSERISADLRNKTYAHLQKLSLEYFGAKRTGDLMSRVSSDTDRICTFLSDSLVDFATDVLMIVGTTIILLSIDPVLAVATLIPFPVIAWLTYRTRNKLQTGFLQGGRTWADMTSILADTIPGIRVVKAFAQETREVERFRASNDRVLEANDRVNAVWTFFWPMVVLLNQVGLIVVWAFGAWRVYEGQITVGVLTAFLAYISRFYTRLESMSRMVTATQRAGASAQRIFEILDRVPSVPEPTRPVHPGRLEGAIEFRNVGFRYGSRQVIQDLNFTIRPGEVIGLVGQTGAGKSTLVNLVCRFYDVSEGAVLVDGVDVRSFPVEEYRRNIGIVLQEPFLFYGTIADNIAYGRPDATREEIIAAARAARAHDFILQLPDGYDSLVGERGQSLSGGERQRISIARALLIDPRILILDEATASVDTETEREIQQALDHLIQGRTTIAIAHRLSTLRKADRLIVLDHGQIVEVGSHHELLEAPGHYSRLHQAQMQLAQELAI